MNYSVLQNFKKKDLYTDPFPYILIRNALPEALYKRLQKETPKDYIMDINENNKRGNIYLKDIEKNEKYKLWSEFLKYHCSKDFFDEVIKIFEKSINDLYPNKLDIINKLENVSFGPGRKIYSSAHEDRKLIRNLRLSNVPIKEIYTTFTPDSDQSNNILSTEANYAYHTNVIEKSVQRGIHLDNEFRLWTGLFYLRDEKDNSKGGDLYLHKWKNNYDLNKKKFIILTEKIDKTNWSFQEHHTEPFKKVGYEANTLIITLATINALHGLTARDTTNYLREFAFLSGRIPFEIYDPKLSLIEKLKRPELKIKEKIKILINFIYQKIYKFLKINK